MKKGATYKLISKGFTDTREIPKGEKLFYRCTKCGGVIPSCPDESTGCVCRSIVIDKDMMRLCVEDYSQFEVVEEVLRSSEE